MSQFIVRVELHDADEADYEKLHDHMKAAGFVREVVVDGVTRMLPPAEYFANASDTIERVEQLASGAATKTLKKFAIVATEAKAIRVVGLKPSPRVLLKAVKAAKAAEALKALKALRALRKAR